MNSYETHISNLENCMTKKCETGDVIAIVREELMKLNISVDSTHSHSNDPNTRVDTGIIINEIEERKSRDKIFVIFGSEEIILANAEDRREHDLAIAEQVLRICKFEGWEI